MWWSFFFLIVFLNWLQKLAKRIRPWKLLTYFVFGVINIAVFDPVESVVYLMWKKNAIFKKQAVILIETSVLLCDDYCMSWGSIKWQKQLKFRLIGDNLKALTNDRHSVFALIVWLWGELKFYLKSTFKLHWSIFISVELILVWKHIVYPHICVDRFWILKFVQVILGGKEAAPKKTKKYIYVSFTDLFFVYQFCSCPSCFKFWAPMYPLSREDFNSLMPSFPSRLEENSSIC